MENRIATRREDIQIGEEIVVVLVVRRVHD